MTRFTHLLAMAVFIVSISTSKAGGTYDPDEYSKVLSSLQAPQPSSSGSQSPLPNVPQGPNKPQLSNPLSGFGQNPGAQGNPLSGVGQNLGAQGNPLSGFGQNLGDQGLFKLGGQQRQGDRTQTRGQEGQGGASGGGKETKGY